MTPKETNDARPKLLLCRPDFYGVQYVINPWMEGNIGRADPNKARAQWDGLVETLSQHADLEFIEPVDGLPDMVFTANCGLLVNDTFIPSRMRYAERRGETPYFVEWFRDHGYEIASLGGEGAFEGEGDGLLQLGEPLLWSGYGVRTSLQSYAAVNEVLDLRIHLLRLVDERFYHLDTCFCPLPGGRVVYYPDALHPESRDIIHKVIKPEDRIEVSTEDALNFACNAVVLGGRYVCNRATDDLRSRLAEWGFEVEMCPVTEFMLSGGAAKCLVLRLDHAVPAASTETETIALELCETEVEIQGDLLDTGLLTRVLDEIVDDGGSFEIRDFEAGLRADQYSACELSVYAPSRAHLDRILARLLALGVRVRGEENDASLQPVLKPGVAPAAFYSTTIYPTEVRVAGSWIPVVRQRMDAAIVVDESVDPAAATCRIIRDLKEGERVVCGAEGIRIHTAAESSSHEAFEFMGAGASSERRVEGIIESIAWDMDRIRERNGKIVVVAGPVVVHTGGAPHLAKLIAGGYVQALLGGNAIAVHDIERALYGTSLGVDMERGINVLGGHRHHLDAINFIRDHGSIRDAVDQGVLNSGVMYECVKHNVPFSLAGSIRDDGPLPETKMDLVAAQAEYAELLNGADLILMLASMLHAIGVGNMTPAGVRLICVDINPAVVTKLADRGSLESVGVVTDVGSFLSLLSRRLIPS